MLRRVLWISCGCGALAGCTRELNPAYCAAHPTDTRCAQIDAGTTIDAMPICVGEGMYMVCLQAAPPPTVNLATNINTSGVACLPQQPVGWVENGQPEVCVIAGIDVTISASITVRGPRPLVIVATDSITLAGAIDGSATKNAPTTIPPGFLPAACAAFPQTPMDDATGGGGGAGGTFVELAGDGGTGDNGNAVAGHAAPVGAVPTVLHGGCGGQPGGAGNGTGGGGGIGGNGGGAIYLVAAATLTLSSNSSIDVSGAGGSGGGRQAGGGGAGSGGMLVLSAGTMMIGSNVTLLANGGGGASGATANANGANGNDPTSPQSPAIGAAGPAGAASGGNGFAGATAATTAGNGTSNDGGGGGGGGGGYIRANQALTGAIASPAETIVP